MTFTASDRRGFLQAGGSLAAALALGTATAAETQTSSPPQAATLRLPPLAADSEARGEGSGPDDIPSARIGFAVVGLGHVALGQVLPGIQHSKHAKVNALVSGDRDKALTVAGQYSVDARSVYDYRNFDRIADNDAIQVVYVALPNALHAEYVVRAAEAGKHVFCEKPMATSVADCQRMIDACSRAGRKLMIGYRNQFEPNNRALARLIRDGKLGSLREFFGANSHNQGDPAQWRLKRALAGGGPLVDVGIYSINGVRSLSGEEPSEVMATWINNAGDPRFREVEESIQFVMHFPSGLSASCSSSYNAHKSAYLRVNGTLGWAEMNPAYSYSGLRLTVNRVVDHKNVYERPDLDTGDQFLREIDHMALCVKRDLVPHTPGEEGLQDQRIIEAIYRSAQTGQARSQARTARLATRVAWPSTRSRVEPRCQLLIGDAGSDRGF